jgi:hypothetical protein
MRRFALLALAFAQPLTAQTVVTSPGPASVSVTIYRDPNRSADTKIELDNLTGFALITETREVDLPKGEVTIRFEGVASGIEPVSSIVIGPEVREKNRDARLLSQRGLLDAFTGQSVMIRRTDPATGKVTEEAGTIRSNPDGVILQTKAGYESLYCSGINQTLLFPRVPADLTAKPTLSVTTRDQPGGRQTITLSYLARKFDWQANYVGELSADAKSVNLLGWMTMASGDDTSFVDAKAFAVAGKLAKVEREDREEREAYGADDLGIGYSCWPSGTTGGGLQAPEPVAPPMVTYAPAPIMMRTMDIEQENDFADIVVTGTKRAEREDLGDLKLYRIPFDVTVAANAQKQVAFLIKEKVKGEIIYRSQIYGEDSDDIQMLYRIANKAEAGLGEAMPAGQVALFQSPSGRRMLVGESQLGDKAVGEDIELVFAEANNVTVDVEDTKYGKGWDDQMVTVSNANPFPITYEAEFALGDGNRYERFTARLFERKGKRVWRVVVPANGEAKLGYREVDIN